MRAAWKCKQKYLQRRQGIDTENGEKINGNKTQKNAQAKDS